MRREVVGPCATASPISRYRVMIQNSVGFLETAGNAAFSKESVARQYDYSTYVAPVNAYAPVRLSSK